MIQQNKLHHFTQNQLHILMISIVHIVKNTQNLWKSPYFDDILPFLQCAQNTKQFISVDSPSWAEQNGTDNFVVACTVVEILQYTYVYVGSMFECWSSFCDFQEIASAWVSPT